MSEKNAPAVLDLTSFPRLVLPPKDGKPRSHKVRMKGWPERYYVEIVSILPKATQTEIARTLTTKSQAFGEAAKEDVDAEAFTRACVGHQVKDMCFPACDPDTGELVDLTYTKDNLNLVLTIPGALDWLVEEVYRNRGIIDSAALTTVGKNGATF